MGRRDNSDPSGIGQTLNWAWAWPANRRVLYNRASCDTKGKPFDPTRKLIGWNGTNWAVPTSPTTRRMSHRENGMGPFIMLPEGVARFFARDAMAEGPFPEHYEPFESPVGHNPLHPEQSACLQQPGRAHVPQ